MSNSKTTMFPTLSLEEFHRIIHQEDSIHLKMTPPKPDATGKLPPVSYIQIELVDSMNNNTKYPAEFKLLPTAGGKIKTPDERGTQNPNFVLFKSTSISTKNPDINVVDTVNKFFDIVKEKAQNLIDNKIVAEKKFKTKETLYIAGNAKLSMNAVCYETGDGVQVSDPFVRVTLYTNKDDKNKLREPIYDATKPKKDANGNVIGFEEARNKNGQIYSASDVHTLIVGGTVHMGVLNMNSICLSAQGLSIPVKIINHIIKPGISKRDASVSQIFDSNELNEMSNAVVTETDDDDINTSNNDNSHMELPTTEANDEIFDEDEDVLM